MICRAIPRFLKPRLYTEIIKASSSEYYFNYGRTALSFFLSQYQVYKQKNLRVGVQAFNCSVVNEAIIHSKNTPVYLDIKLSDYSISSNEILNKNIDILIVTHYQGIKNIDYDKILEICHKNNILIIDDISQSEFLEFKNTIFKPKRLTLHSYSFDKPISSLFGGKLKLVSIEEDFEIVFKKKYTMLECESEKTTSLHLRILLDLTSICKSDKYTVYFSKTEYIHFLYKIFKTKQNINFIINYSIINKIMFRVFKKIKFKNEKILRAHDKKVSFIINQKKHSKIDNSCIIFIDKKFPNIIPKSFLNNDTYINRLSLIHYNDNLIQYLKDKNVEYGNYNWPKLICDDIDKYPNSLYVSRKIINIPLWKEI